MKKISSFSLKALTILLAFTSINTLAKVNEITIYDNSGYPYQQLIDRYDSVQIRFIEGERGVTCKVEMQKGSKVTQYSQQSATQKQFNKAPLQACIAREEAKQALHALKG